MRRTLQAASGLVLGLLLSVAAEAQVRIRVAAPFRISSPPVSRMAQAPRLVTSSGLTNGTVVVVNNSTLFPTGSFFPGTFVSGTFPVPGLGFDFAHLHAITRNLKSSDISVLSTAQRLALLQALTPVTGFAIPFFPAAAPIVVVQQPPIVIVQQPAPPVPEAAAPVPPAAAPTAQAPVPQEPVPDIGEFVLVRRDGKVLFAVAFYSDGKQLTYITPEGVRRTLPLSQLDVESTLRMNEERGTTLQLPI